MTYPGFEELQALRARLDRIDESLLSGLRERLACCGEIAAVKRRNGMPAVQPRRAGAVHRHVARFAAENDLDADFVHRVYSLIMEESCRIQDAIITDLSPLGAGRQPSLRRSSAQ